MTRARIAIASLAASAALLVGVAQHEGYTDRAIIPIKGDVPTKGFGTTKNQDGTAVKLGDTTTPQRALVDLLQDINKHSNSLKRCIDAPLYQHEFDAYSSLAYNVGAGAVCSSTIPQKLREGRYEEACHTIKDFNGICLVKSKGRCIKKKVIKGLVTRRQAEYQLCMGEG
jgi:lysozyme